MMTRVLASAMDSHLGRANCCQLCQHKQPGQGGFLDSYCELSVTSKEQNIVILLE